jgi:serine/threonine protein kinase
MATLELSPIGSLTFFLKKRHPQTLPREAAYTILMDVAVGMNYIHTLEFLHRDLKPSNILVFPDFYLKICDFGVARKAEEDTSYTEGVGTTEYRAPECHNGNYTLKIDSWSYGVMAGQVLAHPNYVEPDDVEIEMNEVTEDLGSADRRRYTKRRRACMDFLEANHYCALCSCLEWQHEERLSFHEIIQALVKIAETDPHPTIKRQVPT